MSSGKIRKDKTCLNCGHEVEDLFCTKCGQKNVEIKDNFWHLSLHYIQDYFHFDSKLLHSLKPLLFKPGFLPKEYMAGRRAKYINPIGSFIFLSTVFFIISFSFNNKSSLMKVNNNDSTEAKVHIEKPVTIQSKNINLHLSNNSFIKHLERVFAEGNENEKELFFEKFKHNFPKVMVLLIPFLAFFLWLFYIRKRMLYVEHLIFVIYTHCFIYLFLTLAVLVSNLWEPAFEWSFLIVYIYIIASMKNFYHQGWFKTIVKFCLVGICYCFLLLIGIALNAMIAAW